MKIYVVCEHLSNVLLYTYTDKYTHTYTEIQTHKKDQNLQAHECMTLTEISVWLCWNNFEKYCDNIISNCLFAYIPHSFSSILSKQIMFYQI